MQGNSCGGIVGGVVLLLLRSSLSSEKVVDSRWVGAVVVVVTVTIQVVDPSNRVCLLKLIINLQTDKPRRQCLVSVTNLGLV